MWLNTGTRQCCIMEHKNTMRQIKHGRRTERTTAPARICTKNHGPNFGLGMEKKKARDNMFSPTSHRIVCARNC
ncbi:hypothetical protein OUZ56_000924 [Daphnia magna]|uniref:Uncharacterized protein n=1 Tax=Daphnia magna TaxID=35525 RepID=A0ABR0A1Q3_9CRUS|nr:hypothetical protein OUZ56_000924 [Daphnia magna]